jgi:hypothetical protein
MQTNTDSRFITIIMLLLLGVSTVLLWTRFHTADNIERAVLTPTNNPRLYRSDVLLTKEQWDSYCSKDDREVTGLTAKPKLFPAHSCVAGFMVTVEHRQYDQCILLDAPEEVYVVDGVKSPTYNEVQSLYLCTK